MMRDFADQAHAYEPGEDNVVGLEALVDEVDKALRAEMPHTLQTAGCATNVVDNHPIELAANGIAHT